MERSFEIPSFFTCGLRCYRSAAIEPLLTRCCNFSGRMIQAASGGVDASRAAVGGRDAASGNVMPSIYRLRRVGPTKDSRIVFDYGIGNSQENICRVHTSGKILPARRSAKLCLAWRTFYFGRSSGRLPSDAARSRQAEVALGSGRSVVG